MLKNKLKTKFILFSINIIFIIIFTPLIIKADIPALKDGGIVNEDINTAAKNIGYSVSKKPTIEILIAEIVKNIIVFLGVFFLVLIISGGYQWMSAGGNEEIVAKAKKRIINATIGLAIVLGAYVITHFIFIQIIMAPHPI